METQIAFLFSWFSEYPNQSKVSASQTASPQAPWCLSIFYCYFFFKETSILPVKTGTVLTCDQGADMSAVGVKHGGQECFEMVNNGGGHQIQESFQTLESTKGGGQHGWVSGRGYRQSMMDLYRYSYSDWQNFTRPYLNEVSMLKCYFLC